MSVEMPQEPEPSTRPDPLRTPTPLTRHAPAAVIALAVAVVVLFALLLTGCTPAPGGDPADGPGTTGTPAPTTGVDPATTTPAPATTPTTPAPTPGGVLAEVVRVVDGDTARVHVDGEELVLRFIGLDTPETVHPSQPVGCYGPEATEEAKAVLPAGAMVRLYYDPTQGRTDYYGRELVYLELPAGMDYAEHMIATGHGTEYRYRKDYQRMGTYREAEAAAQEAGRGLWGACATGG